MIDGINKTEIEQAAEQAAQNAIKATEDELAAARQKKTEEENKPLLLAAAAPETPAAPAAEQPNVPLLKLGEMVGYYFAKDDEYKHSTKPINHVAASNGVFTVRNTPLGTFVKKNTKVKLEELKEGVYLNIPKIPFTYFNQALTFMRAIYDADKTESTIMLFYNEERNEFFLWAPKQTNSSAASNYKRDDDPDYTALCAENMLVMVIHSHPWGGTTVNPSGIDDRDEKEALLFMVVGNVCGIPNTYVSTCPGGERMKLNFFDVFENPIATYYAADPLASRLLSKHVPEKDVFEAFSDSKSFTVPVEWIQQCAKSYSSGYQGNTYYGGYQGNAAREASRESAERASTNLSQNPNVGNNRIFRDEELYAERYYGAYGYGYEENYHGNGNGYVRGTGGIYVPESAVKKNEDVLGKSNLKVIDLPTAKDVVEEDEDPTEKEFKRETEFDMLGDAIDATLDLSDVNLANLVYVLIDEGKEGLIRACLKQKDKEDQPVEMDTDIPENNSDQELAQVN